MSSKSAQNDLFGAEPSSQREVPAAGAQTCRRVLVPYPVDKAYDYLIPAGMDVRDGDYVCVPLGGREIPGVVWGEAEGSVARAKLKSAVALYDMPPMPKVQRDFIDWVAHYTMSPKGSVLKMSVSVAAALSPPPPVKGYRIIQGMDAQQKGLSPQRRKVLEALSDGHARRPSEIAELAGVSAGVVKGLADAGFVQAVDMPSPAPCSWPDVNRAGPELSVDQRAAADILCAQIDDAQYHASLLDGVTGAGKTEVYFEAVAKALKAGKQVLILLPEIALSNAFMERFKSRFGCAPALWHSHLTPVQRRNTWRGVASGETRVVVGARSALFLPYADLGLIVVDEEHDPAYKQEDGVIYHARDMAIVRAHLGQFPVVLVSATPSLETMYNTWPPPHGTGRYTHIHLPDRFGGAQLPEIEVIDMRANKLDARHFISEPLKAEMKEVLGRGEQVLLFLNRRGYAPLTLCNTCGHRIECPRCTAWLVEHKAGGRLQCHHCGYAQRTPESCVNCGEQDSLRACGPGVERIFEEVKEDFPAARIMVLASDTAEDNESLRKMLADIRERRVDIIIGTQIIAKGHHFPSLTLVGVIDADLGLNGGELRAAERTYQLLHQVAGRAGREEKKGRVLLQSFMPEHRIMKALADTARDEFLHVESLEREAAHMPPYSRLAGIIVASRDDALAVQVAKALGEIAPQGRSEKGLAVQTLGPAPAPMARLRGKYRYRLLLRADKGLNLQKTIEDWVHKIKVPSTVRVYIDIDPQSFL